MNVRARETTGCLRSWLAFSHSRASDTLQSDLNDAERRCFIVQLNTGVIFFHFRSRIWKTRYNFVAFGGNIVKSASSQCGVLERNTYTSFSASRRLVSVRPAISILKSQ